MCKTYLVLNCSKANYQPAVGNGVPFTNPFIFYSAAWFDTLAAAQAKADEFARAGNIGIIFEAKEFRQVQPAPVIVERTECCEK